MSNVLNDLAAEFERLRARKEELEEQTKANNQALREVQEKIIDEMIDQDMPSVTIFTEGLVGEEKATAAGFDRFDVLRENGFDFLIRETVNAQSFNSAITEYLGKTPEDEVPEDLQAIISSYDESKVGRVKASKKALEKLKTMKEG